MKTTQATCPSTKATSRRSRQLRSPRNTQIGDPTIRTGKPRHQVPELLQQPLARDGRLRIRRNAALLKSAESG